MAIESISLTLKVSPKANLKVRHSKRKFTLRITISVDDTYNPLIHLKLHKIKVREKVPQSIIFSLYKFLILSG